MTHTTYRLILALCLISTLAKAQKVKRDFNLESFVESLFNLQEANINYEDLYEQLLLLYENPIDLNSADDTQLSLLFFLSKKQIDTLLAYRDNSGKLLSQFELLYLEGFTPDLLEKLQPFITVNSADSRVDDRPLLQRILTERNQYLITRFERVLESKRGYQINEDTNSTPYAGSPNRLYMRYRASKAGDFSIGFTTEKDPGEQLRWDTKQRFYGMDYWSGHIMLEKLNKVRKIVIGDYQLQFGQGLLFGGGFGTGKGSETINTLERTHLGIRPYTSVIEGGFLRGIATTYKLKGDLSVTGFVSSLRQDGNIRQGDNDEAFEQFFSSVQLSGLHRTATEIANRKQIRETVYGLNLNYQPDALKQIGIIVSANQFSLPIQRSNQPHNLFEFSGTSNLVSSIYGNLKVKAFNFFGEAGLSKSGGTGSVGGFTTSLSPRIDFAMVVRNFTRDFHSFRGSAFGESGRNINERGVYWGIKYLLNRQFYLTAYYDTFRFPWLRFRVNAPSQGSDYLIRLNYIPKRSVAIYFQFRRRNREQNANEIINNTRQVLVGQREQVLANFEFRATNQLTLKSRIQYSTFDFENQNTNGIAVIQDAILSLGDLSISGRMALFDTEGQENRQYAYERDVLYAFSIPAYSGRGIRNYILLSYQASRQIDIWIRLARTTFYDRDEIGTGLERIDGNKRTEAKIQMRYKLN